MANQLLNDGLSNATVAPYVYREYPKMLYRGEETCLAATALDEAKALDEGWQKTPSAHYGGTDETPASTVAPVVSAEVEPDVTHATVAQLKDRLAGIDDVALLRAFRIDEARSSNRASALKAIDARLAELD